MPEYSFILYKPAVPGNVGASARALKTMGFSSLRLIRPCDHLSEEARMMAHGSIDILQNAGVYKTFEEATGDIDYLVCTTAKRRSAKHDFYSSRDLADILNAKKESIKRIGIVFGTEESGLPNAIIQTADLAVTIPMQSKFPSLNLSQSVMIMAYELSTYEIFSTDTKDRSENENGFFELKQRTRFILNMIGIAEGTPLYHRIMERVAILQPEDISLLHSISSKLGTFMTGKNEIH